MHSPKLIMAGNKKMAMGRVKREIEEVEKDMEVCGRVLLRPQPPSPSPFQKGKNHLSRKTSPRWLHFLTQRNAKPLPL